MKSETLAVWTTTPEQDKGNHQEPDQSYDFDTGEPKLGFAIETDWKEIEGNYNNHHDGNPHSDIDGTIGIPVSNHQPSSGTIQHDRVSGLYIYLLEETRMPHWCGYAHIS